MTRLSRIVVLALGGSTVALADFISVPNASFESPAVMRDDQNPFGALPFLDDWDETAPGLDDEFDQNTGVFLNTAEGSPDHVINADEDRLAFVSSLIGNNLRQQLGTAYALDHRYRLTLAAGTSMVFPVGPAEELELSLCYVDEGVEHAIATGVIAGVEVNATELVDLTVTTPYAHAESAWGDRPILIRIRPSVTDGNDEDGEGFWNLDHVRLEKLPLIVGDLDRDGDVDGDDVALFQAGALGAALEPLDPRTDLDGDGDGDQSDFGLLQANMTGPM